MKIVLINGSYRKMGATAKILYEFKNQLDGFKDIDAALYHLSDLKIEYCKGCCICYKIGECIINDSAETLSKEISEADGLIIGSPNYASAVSGQLKTFIDRGRFGIGQMTTGKYTIPVITYENADGGSALKFLKKMLTVDGAINIGEMLVKIPFDQSPLDEKRIEQIGKLCNRMYNAIKVKAKAPIADRVFHAVAIHFVLKPFVRRKGAECKGIAEHWKKMGI
jgi:multimeric flavodoxin WrbA